MTNQCLSDLPALVDVATAAEILFGSSEESNRRTILYQCRKKRIRHQKIGKFTYVLRDEIYRMLNGEADASRHGQRGGE